METSTIIYALLAVLSSWLLYRRLYHYIFYSYPPGPRGWPIVGNMFNVGMKCVHFSIWGHKEQFGDISHFNVGGRDFVCLNTIDSIREAFGKDEYKVAFSGRMQSFFVDYIIPHGMGQNSYSAIWKQQRHLIQNAIKPYAHGLKEIELVVVNELNVLKCVLRKMQGKPFDIHEYISRSVGNIMYIFVIGERFDYDHDIHAQQYGLNLKGNKLLNPATNGILTMFPVLRNFPFGIGKIYQDAAKHKKDLMKHLYYNIKNNSFNENNKGFVYDLLRQQHESNWMTDGHIEDMILDITGAGIVTTTTTLYAFFLILLHRPDIQTRIQQEIDDVVGKNRDTCLDDQTSMPFTQAVILELLRYSVIVPIMVPHCALHDVTFRGFHLKKDTVILPNSWRVHHDEALWEDAWEFKPQRFLDDDGQLLPSDHERRRNLLVFGLGIRRCVGDIFARSRMFLFITHLCRYFTFYNDDMASVPSMDPRSYLPYFVLKPQPYHIQMAVRC